MIVSEEVPDEVEDGDEEGRCVGVINDGDGVVVWLILVA